VGRGLCYSDAVRLLGEKSSATVVTAGQLEHRLPGRTRLVPVDRPGRLPYGHEQIIERAVADVRNRYDTAPDPDRLLVEPFTILELRTLHESVEGRALQRDAFRRLMEPQLVGTSQITSGTRGRPAELFRHRCELQWPAD
jgi:8-oxo-dGTP diphosphatase